MSAVCIVCGHLRDQHGDGGCSVLRCSCISTHLEVSEGIIAQLRQDRQDLLEALRRSEQTLRNLAVGRTEQDGVIADNEAANLRALIARMEAE